MTVERRISEPELPPLRIVDPITLQDKEVPTRKWLVPEWIPHGTVVALYGDGGTGKSLLAQMLMTSAALGRPWLGLETQRVRALGIFCEDTEDELWRRQADINRLLSCNFGDLEDMRWISRVGDDNVLAHHHPSGAFELTGFLAQVTTALRDVGAQLLVVGTAADTFGGNENIRSQVRQYISGALGNIARDCDATILLCAHPSVAGINNGTGADRTDLRSLGGVVYALLMAHRLEQEEDAVVVEHGVQMILKGMETFDIADNLNVCVEEVDRWSDACQRLVQLSGPYNADARDSIAYEFGVPKSLLRKWYTIMQMLMAGADYREVSQATGYAPEELAPWQRAICHCLAVAAV